MSDDFWKNFPPIPGFDCVKMKHRSQMRIFEETKGMTPHEVAEYFRRKAETCSPLAVCETPPAYGKSPKNGTDHD